MAKRIFQLRKYLFTNGRNLDTEENILQISEMLWNVNMEWINLIVQIKLNGLTESQNVLNRVKE